MPAPVFGASDSTRVSSTAVVGCVLRQRREAEVQNLDLALVGHHDVAGLEIAMDDAGAVGCRERIRDLNRVTQRVLEPAALLGDDLIQRAGPRTSSIARYSP